MAAPSGESVNNVSGWPRPAQLAAAFLLGVGGTLLAVRLLASPARPLELQRASLDLNRADRAQLLQLPGVGPGLADRISAARDGHGGFGSTDELRTVPGVGPGRMERLRPWVTTNAGLPVENPKKASPSAVLDLNEATVEQLTHLPGVGPKIAQRIVDERNRGPFRSVEELRRVYGIGAKTLERLRPHVTVAKE